MLTSFTTLYLLFYNSTFFSFNDRNKKCGYAWPLPVYLVFECLQYDMTGVLYCCSDRLTPVHVQCYMKQILSGLDFAHQKGVGKHKQKQKKKKIKNK